MQPHRWDAAEQRFVEADREAHLHRSPQLVGEPAQQVVAGEGDTDRHPVAQHRPGATLGANPRREQAAEADDQHLAAFERDTSPDDPRHRRRRPGNDGDRPWREGPAGQPGPGRHRSIRTSTARRSAVWPSRSRNGPVSPPARSAMRPESNPVARAASDAQVSRRTSDCSRRRSGPEQPVVRTLATTATAARRRIAENVRTDTSARDGRPGFRSGAGRRWGSGLPPPCPLSRRRRSGSATPIHTGWCR